MQFTIVLHFVSALFLLVLVNARPAAIDVEARDVYVPPVLYPHAGTVWNFGERHNVTWSTADPPVNITNSKGLILLRKSGIATPLILANGFSILLGRIEVAVPWVLDGSDYQVVLFGDSGNFSPNFTIQGSGVDL